ncbi:hypothetical protein DH26_gp086 [Chloriridovirus anopheles1]|uniref:Uncharacterized protein n=1 Tax=Chloriridovirus anopheles1 TaxID=1465751 RepID=W8QF37_9VIRU|nr:hypothetical protein DH26_gp086 [Anopheles minimus iridovirus]AHL67579.1 hypothetical protein AMIV_086 [Anopheles minimus iridovirus]
MEVFDAIKFLKQKRKKINPNEGFINQLQEFKLKINNKRNWKK